MHISRELCRTSTVRAHISLFLILVSGLPLLAHYYDNFFFIKRKTSYNPNGERTRPPIPVQKTADVRPAIDRPRASAFHVGKIMSNSPSYYDN